LGSGSAANEATTPSGGKEESSPHLVKKQHKAAAEAAACKDRVHTLEQIISDMKVGFTF
jgi:hypothetical protein